jgi:hypothetical protein
MFVKAEQPVQRLYFLQDHAHQPGDDDNPAHDIYAEQLYDVCRAASSSGR